MNGPFTLIQEWPFLWTPLGLLIVMFLWNLTYKFQINDRRVFNRICAFLAGLINVVALLISYVEGKIPLAWVTTAFVVGVPCLLLLWIVLKFIVTFYSKKSDTDSDDQESVSMNYYTQESNNLKANLNNLQREFQSIRRGNQVDLSPLQRQLSECQSKQNSLLSRMENASNNAEKDFANINKTLDAINSRCDVLEGAPEANIKAEQEKSQEIRRAIVTVSQHVYSPLTPNVSRLKALLEDEGNFYEDEVLDKCAECLRVNGALILEGPTGVGKSTLAERLPHLFWDKDESKSFVTKVEVQAHDTSFDICGGIHFVNKQPFPERGYFLEAILACIANNGCHWLLLNELNRMDTSFGLSGIIDVIPLIHKGADFPIKGLGRAKIRIPTSFRLVCTLNNFDEGIIFPLTQAISERFEHIKILAPKPKSEFSILKRKCRESLTNAIERSRKEQQIIDELEKFVMVLAEVRDFSVKKKVHHFYPSVRQSIKVVNKTCDIIDNQSHQVSDVFQASVCEWFAKVLPSLPSCRSIDSLFSGPIIKEFYPGITDIVNDEKSGRRMPHD